MIYPVDNVIQPLNNRGQKCTSQKKENDARRAVAMTTGSLRNHDGDGDGNATKQKV